MTPIEHAKMVRLDAFKVRQDITKNWNHRNPSLSEVAAYQAISDFIDRHERVLKNLLEADNG